MAGQHLKGAISTAQGNVKDVAGRLTGNKRLEVKGKAQKAQGKVQGKLGDVGDAIARAKRR